MQNQYQISVYNEKSDARLLCDKQRAALAAGEGSESEAIWDSCQRVLAHRDQTSTLYRRHGEEEGQDAGCSASPGWTRLLQSQVFQHVRVWDAN